MQNKNNFVLEGKVAQIKPLQSGRSAASGKEGHKLEILLSLSSDNLNKTYFYPIIFWNARALSANERLSIGDYVQMEGQIVSREGDKNGNTSYFLDLTCYKLEILAKQAARGYTNAPQPFAKTLESESRFIASENHDDDIPF